MYYTRGTFDPRGPVTFRIEITNRCNLHCIMCDHNVMERDAIIMDWDMFTHIVDDVAASGVSILGLNRFGEPTLHPQLPQMAAYAKKKGIKSVSFTTNATLLTEELCRKLLETRALDVIACSLDANSSQTYQAIRQGKGAVFENVTANIERLVAMRNAMGLDRPKVQINSVLMKINQHELRELLRRWEPIVDHITVLPVHAYGGVGKLSFLEKAGISQRGKGKCPLLSYMLVAFADGTAGACCGDSNGVLRVGDFSTQSMKEIWNGPQLDYIRRVHAKRDFEKLPVCRDCDLTFSPLYWAGCYMYTMYRRMRG